MNKLTNKIIILIILLCGCKSYTDEVQETSNEFEKAEFYGKVIEKEYSQWKRGAHHLIVQDTSGQEFILYLSSDKYVTTRTRRSATWEILNVNYIVAKDSGSFEIRYSSKYFNGWRNTTVKY